MEAICSYHAALSISSKPVQSPQLHSIAFVVVFPQHCERTDKAPTQDPSSSLGQRKNPNFSQVLSYRNARCTPKPRGDAWGACQMVDRERTWEKAGTTYDPGSAMDSHEHRQDSYSITTRGMTMTLLCSIWQRKPLLTPEPTVLRSCPVSFKKTSRTDPKRPTQRAHACSEAWHGSQSCLQGRVICESSRKSPSAFLLPAGRDKGQSSWAVSSSSSCGFTENY